MLPAIKEAPFPAIVSEDWDEMAEVCPGAKGLVPFDNRITLTLVRVKRFRVLAV